MSEQYPDDQNRSHKDDVLREALHHWEQEQSGVQNFAAVQRRIAAAPSPLDRPRWSLWRCVKLAGALAWAQLRIVPWLVIPVALVTATIAVLAARFFGVSHGSSAAMPGFASLMLAGIAVTVTMALSTARADQVALSTPIGPPIVVLARVLVVLVMDTVTGVFASLVVASWGTSAGLAGVLAGWMVPLAMIAGSVTLIAIWAAPWAGVVVGLVLTPLVSPPSGTVMDVGLGALASAVHNALTPLGVVAVGVGLFAVAVATARRALTNTAVHA